MYTSEQGTHVHAEVEDDNEEQETVLEIGNDIKEIYYEISDEYMRYDNATENCDVTDEVT
jgi:hypothetical protein